MYTSPLFIVLPENKHRECFSAPFMGKQGGSVHEKQKIKKHKET